MRDKLAKRSEITKETILEDLDSIREATISDYVELQNGVLKYKDFSSLTPRQLKAIESVKDTANGIELKLYGKLWSIERICKMLGYDAPTKTDLTSNGKDLNLQIQVEIIDNRSQVERENTDDKGL
jgi:hypothetical protein